MRSSTASVVAATTSAEMDFQPRQQPAADQGADDPDTEDNGHHAEAGPRTIKPARHLATRPMTRMTRRLSPDMNTPEAAIQSHDHHRPAQGPHRLRGNAKHVLFAELARYALESMSFEPIMLRMRLDSLDHHFSAAGRTNRCHVHCIQNSFTSTTHGHGPSCIGISAT